MKPTVYIETTIISYLTARPSRDVVRAGHQKITRDWWNTQRKYFEVLASELVIMEAAAGDPVAAKKRLKVLDGLKIADAGVKAHGLAGQLLTGAALPTKAARDALHLAIAATNGIDYLLTWNCTHLANGMLWDKIECICAAAGYASPLIGTPGQFFVDDYYDRFNS